MSKLRFLSATEVLHKIHSKELSVEEVIVNLLEHITTINPDINALVCYDEKKLLDQAKATDQHLSTSDSIAPLTGLPVSIKDNIEVKGMVTTGGINGRKDYIPSFDAPVVKRLKDAGAIIIGKTNCPSHCAGFETTNQVYGLTKNPYNLEKTVGSSSGGEAALISAGGSYLGIGSDTGGSIRWPAHFTGLASLVPTFGRVPRTGTIPYYLGFLDSTCIGPIARRVKDLILTLPIIAGPDNWDPRCMPLVYDDPENIDIEGLTIAYYSDNGVVTADPSIKQVINNVANVLTEKNIQVDETYPSVSTEFSKIGQGLNSFAGGIDPQTAGQLFTLQKDQEHFEYYPENIYGLADEWLDLAKQVQGEHAMLAVTWHFWGIKWAVFRSEMLSFMKQYDAIVCPIAATPAFEHGASSKEDFNGMNYLSYTHPYSLTGLPAVTLRGGETADGLPIGFQIITNHGKEGLALKIALYLEEKLGGYKKPFL